MHAYDNWKNPMRDVTDLIGQLEYKSDIVVRHSFFENKMCDVRHNPRWASSHVDDMLDILENHADECDMKRILRGYEYYLLLADNEDPVFVIKRNRVIEAFVDFVT